MHKMAGRKFCLLIRYTQARSHYSKFDLTSFSTLRESFVAFEILMLISALNHCTIIINSLMREGKLGRSSNIRYAKRHLKMTLGILVEQPCDISYQQWPQVKLLSARPTGHRWKQK